MELKAREEKADMVPEFLSGGGEMGQRIRAYNWSLTPLGPVHTWPQSLRTCIRIMLTSRQPIWIGWGKELIKFYNDPYKAIVGGKHPWALGSPASIVWKDIWKDIEPMLKQVMEKDEGTYVESQLLIMERNGYPEETYYTFSYTPIPGDDGKTAGMFCANTDDTDRIISERQLKTLTQLGKTLTDSQTNAEVISRTIDTLKENPYDFPFALFRTIKNNKAILAHTTPMDGSEHLIKKEVDLDADHTIARIVRDAVATRKLQVLDDVPQKVGLLPQGAWSIPPQKAIVLPILSSAVKEPYGVLVIGLNPYRTLDDKYSAFFTLVADQVATSFAGVHVLEEERKRSEALAEIDRAKTTFFSNISHEFRTPLTLLLGPIEDTLHDPQTVPESKLRMDLAYRNALRMQKLVNTLLEFSRMEAGRVEGRFGRVDICTFTRDLASTFRSAIEKAGMQLIFDCGPVQSDVYVDADMWENIVLNLVSNAFKYSKEGSIEIKIREQDGFIRLSVSDTGVGIPKDQLDKIFDRFHRVENIQGRSSEGTGIGLAMVKELVKLHHGSISVVSTVAKGSTFTVSIPAGNKHLSPGQLIEEVPATVSKSANVFIQEALKWIPGKEEPVALATATASNKPVVLLADDNADMREYMLRLLADDFSVITAVNGEDAYSKLLEHKPALVISDVMMPKLDGFGLLEKIRSNMQVRNTPVIFLSARAGEEAKVEGLQAGADDYLVKPFPAKELLVRVHNHIRSSEVRRETEQQFYQMFLQAPAIINIFKGSDFRYELYHPLNKEIFGNKDFTGMKLKEAIPELEGQGIFELLQEAYEGKTIQQQERLVQFKNQEGKLIDRYYNFIYQPWYDTKGKVQGVLNFAVEVTEMAEARKKVEESEAYFRRLANSAPAILWITDKDGYCNYLNQSWYQTTGQTEKEALGLGWVNATHPDDADRVRDVFIDANKKQIPFNALYRLRHHDGIYRWAIDSGTPRFDADGKFEGFVGSVIDVHDAKLAEEKIRESETRYRHIFEGTPTSIWEEDFSFVKNEVSRLKENGITDFNAYFREHGQELNALIQSVNINNINEATLTLLEASSKAELKGGLQNIFIEDTSRAFIHELEIIARGGGRFEYVTALQTLKGKRIEVLVHIDFPANDDYSSVLVTLVDISERRKTEKALQESEEQFRSLAETLPQLVWIMDAGGRQLYASSRWEEYTGIPPEPEIFGNIVHPDDFPAVITAWNNSLATGENYRVELRMKSRSGEYQWFFIQGEPIRNEEGVVVKWIGSATNIHDQKEIEQKLERLVAQRTMELQRSNNDLQQFAHVASHDLKEPLRKIKTFAGRLAEDGGTVFSEKARTYLSKINIASDRMFSMIEGVLNYSMLNAHEQVTDTVNLNDTLKSIEADLELPIMQKSVTLQFGHLPSIEGAAVLLYQLFYNLLNNAIKFSKPNVPAIINITATSFKKEDKEYTEIQLQDNGIGFEKEYAEKIFTTFTRLHSKDQYEGTGLGLSLCKRIVERHGGTIKAAGEKDRGATFTIQLPLKQQRNSL